MTTPEDRSFDHDYDGIQEFDNPLPRWWVYLFVGTIGFAAVYFPLHHMREGQLPLDAYEADMAEWNELHPPTPLPDEETLAALEAEPDIVEHGRDIFAVRCVACHGIDGGGQVGPNLTDDYAIHGWSRSTIV
jgi:cytochrome c oxidase cbb3-type subunit 3